MTRWLSVTEPSRPLDFIIEKTTALNWHLQALHPSWIGRLDVFQILQSSNEPADISPWCGLYVASYYHKYPRTVLTLSPDFHSLSPICKSLSKIIEPCISMRARLIGWSEAEAGFDLCPQVLRRELWSQGHSRSASQSTLHQWDDWTHTCWATPAPDGTIVMTNAEDERDSEREKLGVCALIDLWSERLCPLICRAEEKGIGLRCFRMSLFGV